MNLTPVAVQSFWQEMEKISMTLAELVAIAGLAGTGAAAAAPEKKKIQSGIGAGVGAVAGGMGALKAGNVIADHLPHFSDESLTLGVLLLGMAGGIGGTFAGTRLAQGKKKAPELEASSPDHKKTAMVRSMSVGQLHKLLNELGVKWDNNKAFMDWCEKVVGKRHLDDMTPEERGRLASAAIQKHGLVGIQSRK